MAAPAAADTGPPAARLTRTHARRLREVYRSAGWPWQDLVELELLAAGLLERVPHAGAPDTVRLTAAGLAHVAAQAAHNRRARSAHEALVDVVAQAQLREGRLVWTALSLRARLPGPVPGATGTVAGLLPGATAQPAPAGTVPAAPAPARWRLCQPDVFSIRNTSVAAYLEPVVHEIKVSRADLLGDLKQPDKRQAYLDLGGQCWYVLGCNARGAAIAEPDEVPPECGVMLWRDQRLHVLRGAPRRAVTDLPFALWMALARATPRPGWSDAAAEWGDQGLLGSALQPD